MARVNKGSHSFTCHPHTYPHSAWSESLCQRRGKPFPVFRSVDYHSRPDVWSSFDVP